jgi:hypothetical protein
LATNCISCDAPLLHVPHFLRMNIRVSHSARMLMGCIYLAIAIPNFGYADQRTYNDCIRQACSSYGNDTKSCEINATHCLRELGPTPSMPTQPIAVRYGAIALDENSLSYGYSKDYSSRGGSERAALQECRRAGGSATGCKIVKSVNNSCLALAVRPASASYGSRWAYAYSDDGWVSRRNATRECGNDGGGVCKVVVSFCTG